MFGFKASSCPVPIWHFGTQHQKTAFEANHCFLPSRSNVCCTWHNAPSAVQYADIDIIFPQLGMSSIVLARSWLLPRSCEHVQLLLSPCNIVTLLPIIAKIALGFQKYIVETSTMHYTYHSLMSFCSGFENKNWYKAVKILGKVNDKA